MKLLSTEQCKTTAQCNQLVDTRVLNYIIIILFQAVLDHPSSPREAPEEHPPAWGSTGPSPEIFFIQDHPFEEIWSISDGFVIKFVVVHVCL